MTYLTFPIPLLQTSCFDYRIKGILSSVCDLHLYEHWKSQELELDELSEARDRLEINFYNVERSYQNGKDLFDRFGYGVPVAYIRKEMVMDFYNNEKTEFEIHCFFAFVAIKSIIQKDACKKITNEYILSRMAGHSKKNGVLPKQLKKYLQRYWIDKLKIALQLNWGLKLYGKHTRGFYVSFKMELKDLIPYAEKRRQKHRQNSWQKKRKRLG